MKSLSPSMGVLALSSLIGCGPQPIEDAAGFDASVGVSAEALSQPPDGECAVATFAGHEYWFCSQSTTWATARTRCQSKGLDLARIDSEAENQFIYENLPIDSWIGATDQTVEGAWRWIDNGVQFWSGAISGTPVGNLYSNWVDGEQPDNFLNQDCGAIENVFVSGEWADRACTESLNFVCERALNVGEPRVACTTSGPANAPWPSFRRCLSHQGVSPNVGPQQASPVAAYTTGNDVESSPAVGADGKIYFGSHDGYLYALNANLTLAWRFQTGSAVLSSPAIGPDGTIYVGSFNGRLYAINPTGTQKWSFATGGQIWSSPAVAPNGTIYFGSDNSRFYALSSAGVRLWDIATFAFVRSSPTISPDGTIYVGFEDWRVAAINPDGGIKWTFDTLGPVTSSPAIGTDGTIYVGSYDGQLYALNPGNGSAKWYYTTNQPVTSSPAIAPDGSIVFGDDAGVLRAVNRDGTLRWSFTAGDDIISSPAIGADGIIYFGSYNNRVYSLNSNGTQRWSFATGGGVFSSPAIGPGGLLYVGSRDNKLHAIGSACGTSCGNGQCGNGILDTGEACDTALSAFCSSDCTTTENPQRCADHADCPNGQSCGQNNGAYLGQAGLDSFCWPTDPCEDDPSLACGTPGAACGQCACTPDCEGKTCGDNPSDGCGGLCMQICDAYESDCQLDSDCPNGLVCGVGVGPRFDRPIGTNVCWPLQCDDYVPGRNDCGLPSDPCGRCKTITPPPEQPRCPTCAANQYCATDGTCKTRVASAPLGQVPAGVPPLDVARQTPPFGALPGGFGVGQNGTAQYSIPIEVPPGRGGLQPELALEYDSAAGDGFAGRGWSVSGLPAITRCSKTYATDTSGFHGVRGDATDAFCFAGQRLVATSGTYGGHNTEYRTELDTFVKVVSYDPQALGRPQFFKAWSREGRVMTFGQRPEAVRLGRGIPMVWYADVIEDARGNRVDVFYQQLTDQLLYMANTAVGYDYVAENRPKMIIYGSPGHESSRMVVFTYDDTQAGLMHPRRFIGGGPIGISSPLSRIETFVERRLVRRYQLQTQRSGSSFLLKSVQACFPWSDAISCLPATTFEYDEIGGTLRPAQGADPLPAVPHTRHAATFAAVKLDFDGDGDDDLLYKEPTGAAASSARWVLRLSRGTLVSGRFFNDAVVPTLTSRETGASKTSNLHTCGGFRVLDANEDGRDDLIVTCTQASGANLPVTSASLIEGTLSNGDLLHFLFISQGTSGFSTLHLAHDKVPTPSEPPNAYLIDWDGDGRQDFVQCESRQVSPPATPGGWTSFRRNVGAGNFALSAELGQLGCPRRVVDVDGDGVVGAPDFMAARGFINTAGIHMMDANGDGLQDTVEVHVGTVDDPTAEGPFDPYAGPSQAYLSLNTGAGFVQSARSDVLPTSMYRYNSTPGAFPLIILQSAPDCSHSALYDSFVMDIDGDGRDELYLPPGRTGGPYWIQHTPLGTDGAWISTPTLIPYEPSTDTACGERRQQPLVLDVNGDGVQDLLMRAGPELSQVLQVRLGDDPRKYQRLTAVTNGLGERVDVEYDVDDTGARVYSRGVLPSFPARRLNHVSFPVVSAATVSGMAGPYANPASPAPRQGRQRTTYQYVDGRIDLRGRGFLGFGTRRVMQRVPDTGASFRTVATTTFVYDHATYNSTWRIYPNAGRANQIADERVIPGHEFTGNQQTFRLSSVFNTWTLLSSAVARPFLALTTKRELVRDVLGNIEAPPVELSDVTHTYTGYDGHGNPLGVNSLWDDGSLVSTTYQYAHTTDSDVAALVAKWLISLPSVVTITGDPSADTSAPDRKSIQVRTDYDARGLPVLVTRAGAAEGAALTDRQSTQTIFDANGNPDRMTSTAISLDPETPSRMVDFTFDAQGFFPVSIANGVHQPRGMAPTQVRYDPLDGQLRLHVEPSGDWEAMFYDGSGRLLEAQDSAGSRATIAYRAGTQASGPLEVEVNATGSPRTITELNAFGAPILVRERRLDTRLSVQELAYDDLGRLSTVGVEHLSTNPSPGAVRRFYDDLNRIVREESPFKSPQGLEGTSTVEHRYASRAHTGVNTRVAQWLTGFNRSEAHLVRDPSVFESVDVTGQRGQLLAKVDEANRTATYQRVAFDHVKQTVFEGLTATIVSDELDQTLNYTDPDRGALQYQRNGYGEVERMLHGTTVMGLYARDGLGRTTVMTTPDGRYDYSWDGTGTDPTAIGRLASESLTSSTLGNTRTDYRYQGPTGAISQVSRQIRGQTFTTDISYNAALDLPETLSLTTPSGPTFTARYTYDTGGFGQITQIRDDIVSRVLWTLGDIDAFGEVSSATYGNLVAVTRTRERTTGLLERTRAQLGATMVQDETFKYDIRGLLTYREDFARTGGSLLQEFAYDALGRLSAHVTSANPTPFSYTYDTRGNLRQTPTAGALNYTDAARPNRLMTTGDGRTFGYDARGNQTLREGPGFRHALDYTAFDMPRQLREGPDGAPPTRVTNFEYDASNARVVRAVQGGEVITYVGDLYRQQFTPSTGITRRTAVVPLPDGGTVEVDVDQSAVAARYRYLHPDQQGSVTAISDGSGARVEKRTYQPFGREQETWVQLPRAGYTGHEHDRDHGLINMRGRMYDPAIGRFASADPIASAASTQRLNPYSYVLNSPTNLIDPTGMEGLSGNGWGLQGVSVPIQGGGTAECTPSVCTPVGPSNEPEIEIVGTRLGVETLEPPASWGGGSAGEPMESGSGASGALGATAGSQANQSNGGAGPRPSNPQPGIGQPPRPKSGPNPFFPSGTWGELFRIGVTMVIPFGDAIYEAAQGNYRAAAKSAAIDVAIIGVGLLTAGVGIVVLKALKGTAKGVLFGQKAVGRAFTSAEKGSTFEFAGRSIADVAKGLRSGSISADKIPVRFVTHNGNRIAVNNRSLAAFRRAGMEPTRLIDVSGNAREVGKVMGRLSEMGGMPSDAIRIRGAGSNASAIF